MSLVGKSCYREACEEGRRIADDANVDYTSRTKGNLGALDENSRCACGKCRPMPGVTRSAGRRVELNIELRRAVAQVAGVSVDDARREHDGKVCSRVRTQLQFVLQTAASLELPLLRLPVSKADWSCTDRGNYTGLCKAVRCDSDEEFAASQIIARVC